MTKQLTIEGMEKPHVFRAHVWDAGYDLAGNMVFEFHCKRCDYTSEWLIVNSITEAKHGITCQQK
jgi:polyisoprenoid-binding protein YceI